MKQPLDFKLPVIKIHQREDNNQAIYIGKIKVKDLAERYGERFIIDYYKRKDGEDKGYQRSLSPRSVEKIKDFILKESSTPILPTSILVNSRDLLDFKEQNNCGLGLLEIKSSLYIIDGQHRFEAWTSMMNDLTLLATWGDYEIPIIILSGFSKTREIEQFYVINSRQKKIKTDLAQRMLLELSKNVETEHIVPKKDIWISHAVKIVDSLNEEITGVWKNRIKLEGDSADLLKAKILWQNSFVMSLKPFFVGTAPIFDIPTKTKPHECAKFLSEYWDILAECYPFIIKSPHDYSLMKTVGVFSLHILLANIIRNNNFNVFTQRSEILTMVKTVLVKASSEIGGHYKQEFWKSTVSKEAKNAGKRYAGSYSSGSGHNRLAAGILMNSVI